MKERLSVIKNKTDRNKLLVHEIYASIQGESSHMGLPCVFVRTTGCHLRCSYCDTQHAFFDGKEMDLKEIIDKVLSFAIPKVELTGGEPLLQPASFKLLDALVDCGLDVLLETSGAVSIKNVNRKVKVILDVKTPSSSECNKNVLANLDLLWPGCEVKFVIATEEDYRFAKEFVKTHKLSERTHVLFSPVLSSIRATDLADMIIQDKLNVRFQMQLHRILWGEEPGK
ncbi:MAG: radical SAM protein [Myxococcales bacterium]|nr:MAG: radical SAM protein [Myxococcales bacterium]